MYLLCSNSTKKNKSYMNPNVLILDKYIHMQLSSHLLQIDCEKREKKWDMVMVGPPWTNIIMIQLHAVWTWEKFFKGFPTRGFLKASQLKSSPLPWCLYLSFSCLHLLPSFGNYYLTWRSLLISFPASK